MSGPGDDRPIEELPTLERPPDETTAGPPGRSLPPARGRGPQLQAGQGFGPYRLVSLLGRGGFGQVWEAESVETGRRVALKVLSAPEATPEMLQRFDREGRLAASLNHPHCVYVLGAERIEGYPTIAMELMGGGTLQDLLNERGPLPPAQAVDHALDILEGLEAAHRAGILHRDLKPSNCFLDDQGRARIGDFGLSKTLEIDAKLTMAGSFMGTPAYAAPEQVRGKDVDFRADLYALGATLYALLTGRPPFEGKELGSVLSKILTEPPTPFASHRAAVPKGLQAVVLRLLAKEPEKRFRDEASLRVALVPFSSDGLTASGLPRRCAAFLVDLFPLFLLKTAIGLTALGEESPQARAAGTALVLGIQLLYFLLFEGFWGRTPGKALFGLRVADATGMPVTPRRALVRVAVFWPLYQLDQVVLLVRHVFFPEATPSGALAVALGLVAFAASLAPLITMRRRNGFAGLHELASGTRVRGVRSRDAVLVPAGERASRAPEGPPRCFGPFEEVGPVWRRDGEALLVARDPALKRNVWVHVFPEQRGRPVAEVARIAPGRLRWLQGRRGPEGSWDAYEAPGGISLLEWVRTRGRLRWRELREVLLGVARALDAALASGLPPSSLSLSRGWVDSAPGHARLAEFPLDGGEAGETVPLSGWRAFLRQLTLHALEGRALTDAEAAPGRPRAPFPEHARALVGRLCSKAGELESPAALVRELQANRGRTAEVTRRVRFATLAIPVAVPLASLLFVAAVLAALSLVPNVVELIQVGERVEALAELEGKDDAASRERRESIRMVLAASYARAKAAPATRDILASLPEATRAVLVGALADYPALTDEQVAQAKERSGLPEFAARSGGTRFAVRRQRGKESPAELGAGLVRMVSLEAFAGVGLSAFFGGGPLLYLLGITVQRADGRRAGPLLCLLRSVVAWAPILAVAAFRQTPLAMPVPLLLALAAAGSAWAVARPERGPADLLVGTRLVPR